MLQESYTVKSLNFVGANFCGLCFFFAYSWGCIFVDTSVFRLVKKNKSLNEGMLTIDYYYEH